MLIWAIGIRAEVDVLAQQGLDWLQSQAIAQAIANSDIAAGQQYAAPALTTIAALRKVPYFLTAVITGLVLIVLPVLSRVRTRYRLSAARISMKKGIIFRRELSLPLSEVYEVHVAHGIMGTLLGYGDIELGRRLQQHIILQGVPFPSGVAKKISTALNDLTDHG